MRYRSGIVFISIAIVIVIFVLALMINHMICVGGDAPEALLRIDTVFMKAVNAVGKVFTDFFDYTKYLFEKITTKKTPEYPADQMPLYPECKIREYSFDENTNTVDISLDTADTLAIVSEYYDVFFTGKTSVDYFKQYISEDDYTAYGMIGNFTFLLQTQPSSAKKYSTTIDIHLHYMKGSEAARENFFRSNGGMDSYLFTHPYIYMYQLKGDNESVYLQLRDYKSQLLNIETNVELYIDNVFYSSRYYGDTIRVPIDQLNGMHRIEMISYDENGNVAAMDILENAVCYNAAVQQSLYDLTEKYSNALHIFMYNTESLTDISFFFYFPHLQSLYFEGSDKIQDYSSLLLLEDISLLSISGVDDDVLTRLFTLQNLKMLEIQNTPYEISLGESFISLQAPELIIKNCTNILFDEYGLFSFRLERLEIENNYSMDSLSFISPYPNFRMLSLKNVDNLYTITNTANLEQLNMLSLENCRQLDFSQPINTTSSLMRVDFADCASLGKNGDEHISTIWQSDNLLYFSAKGCSHISDISYQSAPWDEVN